MQTQNHHRHTLKDTRQYKISSASPCSIRAGASRRGHAGIAARWTLGGADGVFDEICVKEASRPTGAFSVSWQQRYDPCPYSSRPRFGSFYHSLPFSIDSPYPAHLLCYPVSTAGPGIICIKSITLSLQPDRFCVLDSIFDVYAPSAISMLR